MTFVLSLTDGRRLDIIRRNYENAMREKQIAILFRELPVAVRQHDGEAFHSGAANDEFDGYARYSWQRWPYGKLGGNAGNRFSSLFRGENFLFPVRQIGWYREMEKLVPKGRLLRF